MGTGLHPAEKDRIELTHLTVGDLVTIIREASERLVEDNAGNQLIKLASRFDDFGHLADGEPWRSELPFIAMAFGMSGATLGKQFKESSPATKKEAIDLVKEILGRTSQHMITRDWNLIHNDLRDLYATVHKTEMKP